MHNNLSRWEEYKKKSKIKMPFDTNDFLNIDLISEEISNKRLNICYSCKELIRLTTECRQSKNFMFKETKIKNTKCPLRKW
jgi:hypothetical protein